VNKKIAVDTTVNDMSLTPKILQSDVLRHLTSTIGKDVPNASVFDWRMALSYAIRDRIVDPWFASTRRTWAEDHKRVYYLSMEFLIGRLLEDATVNLGLRDTAIEVMATFGQWGSGPPRSMLHRKHGDGGLPGLWLRHPL
jgi:starch phosphorylase